MPLTSAFRQNQKLMRRGTQRIAQMVRGTGFEPADSTLQQQPLAGQGTQGGTQNYSDPILARLVTIWPTLSEERRKAVLLLLDLP
jgi:hypothetical protein